MEKYGPALKAKVDGIWYLEAHPEEQEPPDIAQSSVESTVSKSNKINQLLKELYSLKHSEKQVKLHNAQLLDRNVELYDKSQEVKQRHEKTIERNKLLMKENASLYRKLRLFRLQLKEQAVPVARPLGLEALAQIATSMEGELQDETHQEEITSLVREKGASSKKS
jgi:hypothetical protein